MLNCSESELISAFIDNELNTAEAKTLELHLEGCRACREELEELRHTKDLTAAAPGLRAPSDLSALLVAQATAVRSDALEARRTRFPMWAGGLAAAASLVVWVGVRQTSNPAGIPMDSLLAAHERPTASAPLHEEIRAASTYSALLARAHDRTRS